MTRTHFELREYLSKREASILLDCSMRTIARHIAADKFTVIRGSQMFDPLKVDRLSFAAFVGDVSKLCFDPEPFTAPVASRPSVTDSVTHNPEPLPPCPLSGEEQRIEADLKFAAAYLAGRAVDSAGNRVDGSNDRFPTRGIQSLIGPVDENDRTPPQDTQSHMNPALIGRTEGKRHSFDQGLSTDQHAAMMADWRRRRGAPSMSQQREAQERSKAILNEAFNYARRSR